MTPVPTSLSLPSPAMEQLNPTSGEELLVQLKLGALLGRRDEHGGRCFHGVPYGRAGRWELPVEAQPWDGVRDATEMGPICPQLPSAYMEPLEAKIRALGRLDREDDPVESRRPSREVQDEERCLNLNVMTPGQGAVEQGKRKGGLPVVFWIHGGSFRQGHANHPTYTRSPLAVRENLILVAANYRTSIFGFPSSADLKIPGNHGLHDLRLALRFVAENIDRFGGDPSNITLLGESAGAILASYILLDPPVPVAGAVLISGSATSVVPKAPGTLGDSSLFSRLAASCLADAKADLPLPPAPGLESPVLGPQRIDTFESADDAATLYVPSPPLAASRPDPVAAMRAMPARELLKHLERVEAEGDAAFAPCFDGALIAPTEASHPFLRMEDGFEGVKRVAMVVCGDEGTMFVPQVPLSNPHVLDAALGALLPLPALRDHAKAMYGLNDVLSETEAREKAAQLIGDMAFYAPTLHALRSLAQQPSPPTLHGMLHLRPLSCSPFPEWGAHHSSPLPFIFAADAVLDASERRMAAAVGRWLGRFARGERVPATHEGWTVADDGTDAVPEDAVWGAGRRERCGFWIGVAAGVARMQVRAASG